MIGTNLIANAAGILSLLSSCVVVSPTLTRLFQKDISYKKEVFNICYVSLLMTICLGLIHGLLTTQIANIDFSNIGTYWMYGGGLFVFNLFIFLAIAFAELKQDREKLNYLNYAALLLLTFHIGQKIIP